MAYDPVKEAEDQRRRIQGRGDELLQEEQNRGNHFDDLSSETTDFLNPITRGMASGNGGYTPEEREQIMQSGGNAGNFLTSPEETAITGDTDSWSKYFNPEGMAGAQQDSAGLQRNAAQSLKQGVSQAVNPDQLRQSADYRAKSDQSLKDNRQGTWNTILGSADNVRGAIGDEGANVRGAIDPSAVQASDSFLQDYNLSPQEKQDMIESAGISAGTGYRAATGELQRRAAAAGASPMGVGAYRARMERAAAGEAGDAMTKARVAASQEEAARKLTGENLREAGGRYITDTKVGSELDLGKQRAGAEQAMGSQAIDTQRRLGENETAQANAEEANRQGAEQYLTGASMDAAKAGGQAQLSAEQGINEQQRQQQQFNATTGTNLATGQDKANSDRAGVIATNRQNANLTNQTNAANHSQAIASTRIGQQNKGLDLVTGQSAMQNQNAENSQNRQQQTYGTQTSGANQARAIGAQADAAAKARPSTFDKVMGGISGGLTAAASFLADGGVATEPTLAVIGEDGPEAVVPLDGGYRAKTRPSIAMGKETSTPMRNGLGLAAGIMGGVSGKPSPFQQLGKSVGDFAGAYRAHQGVKHGMQDGMDAQSQGIDEAVSTSPYRAGRMPVPPPPAVRRRQMYGEVA